MRSRQFNLKTWCWCGGIPLLFAAAATIVLNSWWIQAVRYKAIRDDWAGSSYAQYLPAVLPPNATHVSLDETLGWGQGGSETVVCYRLPRSEIQTMIQRFYAGPLPPQTSPFLSRHLLEPTYVIYALAQSNPSNWNHPHEYGVAIDPTTDEVCYWISAG